MAERGEEKLERGQTRGERGCGRRKCPCLAWGKKGKGGGHAVGFQDNQGEERPALKLQRGEKKMPVFAKEKGEGRTVFSPTGNRENTKTTAEPNTQGEVQGT